MLVYNTCVSCNANREPSAWRSCSPGSAVPCRKQPSRQADVVTSSRDTHTRCFTIGNSYCFVFPASKTDH